MLQNSKKNITLRSRALTKNINHLHAQVQPKSCRVIAQITYLLSRLLCLLRHHLYSNPTTSSRSPHASLHINATQTSGSHHQRDHTLPHCTQSPRLCTSLLHPLPQTRARLFVQIPCRLSIFALARASSTPCMGPSQHGPGLP